jgi:predicted nucleic acid-binding protein
MNIMVDTSIFVELLMDQDRAEECESLLDAVAHGDIEATVSHFSLHGIESMLPSQRKLAEFLKDVETSKGLNVYDTSLSDEISVSILSGKTGLDFDDSLQLYVAKRSGSVAIVSFDRHFEGQDIPRRAPSEILDELKLKAEQKTPKLRSKDVLQDKGSSRNK